MTQPSPQSSVRTVHQPQPLGTKTKKPAKPKKR